MDKTPIKKIKLTDYELGTTLGTGIEKVKQDHLVESGLPKTRNQEFFML